MKKIPIFIAAALPLAALAAQTETVPSLVVGHYYGVDTYPVHLEDYNRIEIGDTHYTLKANSGNTADDIKLSYAQYPRFWVEDVAKDLPTSVKEVVAGPASPVTYCAGTQLLETASEMPVAIAIYNLEGKMLLSGAIVADRPLSVGLLPAGIYIAATSDHTTTSSLKFVK